MSHGDSHHGEDERRHADDRNRDHDVHTQKSKGDAHGKRIDARRNGQHEQLFKVKPRILRLARFLLIALAEGVEEHLPANKREQDERNPVIDRRDEIGELRAERPADKGHKRLKAPEEKPYHERLPHVEALHPQPLANGNGKSVHRQPHADQKQLNETHGHIPLVLARKPETPYSGIKKPACAPAYGSAVRQASHRESCHLRHGQLE